MFRNYLLTALRNHLRQSGYTFISLAGLTLGLAVATLAFLHVWQETHFDRFIPDAERVHLIEMVRSTPGRSDQLLITVPGPLVGTAAESVAGIEDSTRALLSWYTLSVNKRLQFNARILAADANFAEFMGFEIVEGDGRGLANPSAVLVSESMARRLFGDGPYLGQKVTLDKNRDVEIAAVFADLPLTSHLDAQFIIASNAPSVTDRRIQVDVNWNSMSMYSYLRLAPGVDPGTVGDAIEQIAYKNIPAAGGLDIEQTLDLSLEPVTALHLNGKTYFQRPTNVVGNTTALGITAMIALLVLLIACINSINIATARSADRAHEVGLRKVLGASRAQLVIQFLGESALLVLVSTVAALVLVEIGAGPVGDFVGRTLSLGVLLQPAALAAFIALVIVVVLLSGLYPAFVLANFKPARIFKPAGGARGLSLRSTLVVFQFVISIALMVMAGTVWQQVRYLESADLGFDRDDIVLLPGIRRGPQQTIDLTRKLDESISGRPGIVHVTGTHSSPSWDYADDARIRPQNAPVEASINVDRLAVDFEFFDVLRVTPLAGRVFDPAFGPDRAQWDLEARGDVELPLVVNSAALASLGYSAPADIVGEPLELGLEPGNERSGRVVGVVPDFHFKSLKSEIRPMVFFPDPARFNLMMVRIDGVQREQALASIEEGWRAVLPGQSLSRSYLDRGLVDQYVSEQRQFTLLAVLAGIAIFIAMLGLVGLLAHAVAARRREISLRKVLGAELGDVLTLFLWQFSRPVMLAVIVAWPLAWWL
ncbi:MAG: ABC transporter permease, partial [Pseudomonadota bacterium]